MPVLPIPMIIALLLFAFLAHRMLTRETHVTLLALIAACAVQGAIVALVQYYGFTSIRPLQPLWATLIPPIAWLAFSQAARGDAKPGDLPLHSAGFVLALLFLLLQPQLLDVLIPLLFAGYGVAMMLRLGRGEDSLPHSRLESGTMPLLAWRIIARIADRLRGLRCVHRLQPGIGEKGVLLWVPSVFSSLVLLSLGAVSLSHAIESRHDDGGEVSSLSPEDSERDQSIVTKLDDYVRNTEALSRPGPDPGAPLAAIAGSGKAAFGCNQQGKGENVEFLRQGYELACSVP